MTKRLQADRAHQFKVGEALGSETTKLVEAARASSNPGAIAASRDVEAAVLLVRVANWRFIATADPKGTATFTTSVEKAGAALAAFEKAAADAKLPPLVAPAKAALDAYSKHFADLSTAMLDADKLFDDEMRPQMIEAAKIDNQALASLQADQLATKTTTDVVIPSTMTTQEALVAVLLALSALLAVLIGRSIARPVVAMTAAMRQLAAGDKAVEIPGVGRKDEIGEMAGAVQVFKDNM